MTKEEFKKVYNSFELKNEKKISAMRMNLWGWGKMPDIIKHWEAVGDMISIPAGLRGFWKFENKYPEIKNIQFPEIENEFEENELDLKQNITVENILKKDIGLLHASTGVGKAQPLSSKLLGNNGWIKMGDIKIGDKIFGDNGKITNVIGVYPQGEKDIYEIIFNDGTKAESCLDHLWTVQDYNDRKKSNSYRKVQRTVELLEIKNNLIKYKGLKNERLNYSLNINNQIEFTKKILDIHPYILGVLLGDGNIRNKNISFSNSEKSIIDKFSGLLCNGDFLISTPDKRNNSINNSINNNLSSKSLTMISDYLEKYNLIGTYSDTKFIPENYLYSDIEDRVELLRGLFDTDGYIIRNAQIEYTTTSKKLIEGVEFLVRSLGGTISCNKKKSSYKKHGIEIKCKDHYRAYIVMPKNIIPVSSSKHLNKFNIPKKIFKKYIKEVNFKRKEEAQCIMVNNDSHLYITDDFTVTHNTMITAKLIKKLSVKTLIVVFGIELMTQMKDDLFEIFGVTYKTFSGQKTKQKLSCDDIIIANIDTLAKQDKEFFKQFDLVILDEVDCYFSAEPRLEMMWKKLTMKYIYGLTGTIKLNYIPSKIFDIYLGPKTELLEKHFHPKIYRVLTGFEYHLDDIKKFYELKEALYKNEDRNNLIINTVLETIGDRKGILFSEYIEHAKLLKDKFESEGIKCFLLIGEITKDERKKIKSELISYKGKCILIGSVKIVGRGFNVPELSVGYLTTCEKFISNIEQYVGRIIRIFPGKTGCEWFDFVDSGCRTLLNQSNSRNTTYKKEFPLSTIQFYG